MTYLCTDRGESVFVIDFFLVDLSVEEILVSSRSTIIYLCAVNYTTVAL